LPSLVEIHLTAELAKAQAALKNADSRIVDAVHEFAAALTTHPESITVGASHNAAVVAERVKAWLDANEFSDVSALKPDDTTGGPPTSKPDDNTGGPPTEKADPGVAYNAETIAMDKAIDAQEAAKEKQPDLKKKTK
jgi:hypothetical protein